jgi:enoyl-CoA hydratase/carnithine racemase
VHVLRYDELALERPVGARRDRDVCAAGELEHAERVGRGLLERLVAPDGGDAEQLDFRAGEREQDRDRVVVPGVAVEEDRDRSGDGVPLPDVSGLATAFRHLEVREEGPAVRIVLNRPEKRNALSLELMLELIEALRAGGERAEIRAIVLEGAGPAFSAGHDLAEMIGREPEFYDRLFEVCTVLMETVHRIPQPVIAKVHGIATAAGCQLVASCDLVVASEEARFATPGVRIGLFCSTPMVPISRAVGRKRAMELLLTGEPIDARTAADWGLVNRVVPAERLEETVQELVAAVARSSPLTVGIGKEAFYAQVDLAEGEAYEHTKGVMARNALAAEAQEGMGAFLEKRRPTWTGS